MSPDELTLTAAGGWANTRSIQGSEKDSNRGRSDLLSRYGYVGHSDISGHFQKSLNFWDSSVPKVITSKCLLGCSLFLEKRATTTIEEKENTVAKLGVTAQNPYS